MTPVSSFPAQFYNRMKPSEVTEAFLWEQRLEPLLGYLPHDQVRRVREALSLAYDAHAAQRRKSGEPFITHPVEVTRILAELRMDSDSLAAGLLHDTVEDCGESVGLEEIGFHFGPAVRRIVEGETKFSKLPTHHPEREQQEAQEEAQDPKAQDLQFLFLAMTEEVRIIVVKLADRLHNMRTMASMPPGKQRRIAQETLTVFAPLARLLGLYTIKEELEELSFKYAMPQQYAIMRKAVDRLWEQQRPAVEAAAAELDRGLRMDGYLTARVRGLRIEAGKKALYGVWRKLQQSGKSVRDISEIAQLRVVMDPVGSNTGVVPLEMATGAGADRQLCYHAMGVVHSFWAPIPGTMKDYIATPKPNNYQSLHTTVVPTGLTLPGSDGGHTTNGNGSTNGNGRGRLPKAAATLFPIEIQIRTEEMERLAQYGIAVESWSCADYARGAAQRERASPGETNGSLASMDEDGPGSSGNENGSNGSGARSEGGYAALLRVPLGLVSGLLSGGNSSVDEEDVSSNGARSLSSKPHSSNGNGAAPSVNGSAPTEQRLDAQTMSRRINWLNSIRQWQEEFVGTLTAQEFVACVTDDLLGQGVFVFTPSGQVMRLPKGSTVVDFAYHIHTDVGNTMVAARVNGKVVNADYELANAEVVEVITYKGPINATIIKRHQRWLGAARTKTARYKIAKFLREHAALAASAGLMAPGDSALGLLQRGGTGTAAADGVATEVVWLIIRCDDRQGLLADIANVIANHSHNIRAYSGSADFDAGLFVMEYELEGPPERLRALCDDLTGVPSVQGWSVGCILPDATRPQRRI